MKRHAWRALGMAVGVSLGLGPIGGVLAQERIVMRAVTAGGPAAGGAIAKRSLEKWARTLSLGEEQTQAALALHEGYIAEHQAATREMQSAMREISRTFSETNDRSVFEKTPEISRAYADRTEALEETFMADLKSLLSPEQEPAWGKVERMRRREIGSRFSAISGDTVDLTSVLEGLKLDEAAMAVLAQPVEDYEAEMDRAIQERIRMSEAADDIQRGGPIDLEALQKRIADQREVALKLKAINERHARKLEPLLPEDRREAFVQAVRRETFPRIYRPSHTSKQLEAAAAFTDLDGSQREQLEALTAQYSRELESANEAWAAALERDEADSQSGMMGGPGGSVVIQMGDENKELADARKARRELDERTREKLARVLKPEQQERLPSPPEEQEEGVAIPGRMIIRGG